MARGKKTEVIEVQESILVEELQETEQLEVTDEVVLEPQAPITASIEVPKDSEVVYNPKDIVEFYNLKGDLKYAPYAYISKRGYKPLRKYTKK
jgi:hypothetical protein